MKIKTKRKPNKQIIIQTKQNTHAHTHTHYSMVDTPTDSHWRNLTSPFLARTNCKQLLSQGRLRLSTGNLSGLNLCRSRVCSHGLWEFICVSSLWCRLPPLAFVIFPLPLLNRALPELWGERLNIDISFRAECSNVSRSLNISSHGCLC